MHSSTKCVFHIVVKKWEGLDTGSGHRHASASLMCLARHRKREKGPLLRILANRSSQGMSGLCCRRTHRRCGSMPYASAVNVWHIGQHEEQVVAVDTKGQLAGTGGWLTCEYKGEFGSPLSGAGVGRLSGSWWCGLALAAATLGQCR